MTKVEVKRDYLFRVDRATGIGLPPPQPPPSPTIMVVAVAQLTLYLIQCTDLYLIWTILNYNFDFPPTCNPLLLTN